MGIKKNGIAVTVYKSYEFTVVAHSKKVGTLLHHLGSDTWKDSGCQAETSHRPDPPSPPPAPRTVLG